MPFLFGLAFDDVLLVMKTLRSFIVMLCLGVVLVAFIVFAKRMLEVRGLEAAVRDAQHSNTTLLNELRVVGAQLQGTMKASREEPASPPTTQASSTANESAYRRMLASRQIHRSCDRLTITPAGYCQSTALAFDNRRPLPPFLPVFRGEDLIFGHMLKLFQPNLAIAYQSTCVLHVT